MKKKRVLMSIPGADGHWRGAVTVSKALMESGMEVIFGGHQTIDEIVESAIEEDVDVIGLSVHSGAHIEWARRLIKRLKEKGIKDNFLVTIGGAIPGEDKEKMIELGVDGVFGPGTQTTEIISFIEKEDKNNNNL